MTVTAELCRRIIGIRSSDIGPAALQAARLLLLDGLAVAVPGSDEEALRILTEHHRAQGSAAIASVIGQPDKLGVVAATAINGAAMHVLDFEPMWSPANHALSTTLPVVLALAEVLDVTGVELLTALVKGIEVQGWIRQASRQWEAEELSFHPPGVVGPLGSAVAAAHLLDLDETRLARALGIAASRSSGLMANVGTMTKALHCGQAAANGLEAALLAARGLTANEDIFGEPRGLRDAFFPRLETEELLRFGPPFRVLDPGFAIKLFPCQFGTHFGISAALAARKQVASPTQILAMRLVTPIMAYVDRAQPSTGLDGKFSFQYTAAAAFLDGSVGLATFTEERRSQGDIQALLAKFELTMSPAIPGRFETMHVELEVDDADGRTIREVSYGPPGIWGSTPITEAQHRAKVEGCLQTKLEAAEAAQIIELASRCDQLVNAELRQLLALTRTGPPPATQG